MESPAGEGFKNIPIKVYVNEKPIQKLVRPTDETTGAWTTLQDVLKEFLPQLDTDCGKH